MFALLIHKPQSTHLNSLFSLSLFLAKDDIIVDQDEEFCNDTGIINNFQYLLQYSSPQTTADGSMLMLPVMLT